MSCLLRRPPEPPGSGYGPATMAGAGLSSSLCPLQRPLCFPASARPGVGTGARRPRLEVRKPHGTGWAFACAVSAPSAWRSACSPREGVSSSPPPAPRSLLPPRASASRPLLPRRRAQGPRPAPPSDPSAPCGPAPSEGRGRGGGGAQGERLRDPHISLRPVPTRLRWV